MRANDDIMLGNSMEVEHVINVIVLKVLRKLCLFMEVMIRNKLSQKLKPVMIYPSILNSEHHPKNVDLAPV